MLWWWVLGRSLNSVTQLSHTTQSHNSVTQLSHTTQSHNSVTQLGHTTRSLNSVTQLSHTTQSHNNNILFRTLANIPFWIATTFPKSIVWIKKIKINKKWTGGLIWQTVLPHTRVQTAKRSRDNSAQSFALSGNKLPKGTLPRTVWRILATAEGSGWLPVYIEDCVLLCLSLLQSRSWRHIFDRRRVSTCPWRQLYFTKMEIPPNLVSRTFLFQRREKERFVF